ncbi:hypothetical protein FOA52_001938 [Chlamydomonas sp. UWO 241]|nr:hypothetical protein FOA52_001938 [Chlamydomonas sp. UWO 241]
MVGQTRKPAVAQRKQPQAKKGSADPNAVPNEIVLDDGTKIPVKIPEGMPPLQAQALMEYMQANQDVAKRAHEQAQHMLKTPGMAEAFMKGTAGTSLNGSAILQPSAETAQRFAFLKDDPELAHVFADMSENGPEAGQKYWEDDELMMKVSAKLKAFHLKQAEEAGELPKAPPPINNLFDAAKQGNTEASARYIEEGADVNAKNDKDVTALGIAVGFNKKDVVALLIEKGANLEIRDAKGNTVLHYAAGYGRKEVCEMLIAAGADLDALNNDKQSALDAAKMNKEKALVEVLSSAWRASSKAEKQAATA